MIPFKSLGKKARAIRACNNQTLAAQKLRWRCYVGYCGYCRAARTAATAATAAIAARAARIAYAPPSCIYRSVGIQSVWWAVQVGAESTAGGGVLHYVERNALLTAL